PGLMNQMIHNLIINADQAMPQGGIIQVTALNVQIKDEEVPLLKPGAYVKIMIGDTGVGIPEADLGRIFDPYFTTKKGVSGLGLTTSYSIIKRLDGYINVSSTVGVGTTFEIYLPATLNNAEVREDREIYAAVNG
ncbi:MAG TPA: ATP-binding protein, partial [Bacillota bacterium]|nr:ATP-binding protein [Bacillota bacterium]